MNKFEVGKLFEEGKTQYSEGTRFDFRQDGAVLILFFDRPTSQEIEQIKTGRFEIGFFEKDEIIFMLSRLGSMNYIDAPYSVHLSKPFSFDELREGMGFGLNIFLVDASNGILKALRYIGLSTDFSCRLQKAIVGQKTMKFDRRAYDMKLQHIYANYSTNDLVGRAEAWCRIK
jgi:hypothetical protein